jgi:Fic family protein
MEWFYEEVEAILSDKDLDPYRACAWMQHSFLRIHPFADGNGRIGRLISSIPLLREDLPPVYVSVESKRAYFSALKAADDTGDIDDLANFLQGEAFRAIESLLEYHPSPTPVGVRRCVNSGGR